mmetsp:Transcript_4303/g.6666  ORF Transcript_4303/g.6666 Transcript_4303/m.6666 type:complete len:82 (+) Transcript_4303:698-943(+)
MIYLQVDKKNRLGLNRKSRKYFVVFVLLEIGQIKMYLELMHSLLQLNLCVQFVVDNSSGIFGTQFVSHSIHHCEFYMPYVI